MAEPEGASESAPRRRSSRETRWRRRTFAFSSTGRSSISGTCPEGVEVPLPVDRSPKLRAPADMPPTTWDPRREPP